MGLDNAALRSSSSSSSKKPCEGPAWWWSDDWFGILRFEEITAALEELVVRLAETAVTDEAVRGNPCLAPADLATCQCPKNKLIRL